MVFPFSILRPGVGSLSWLRCLLGAGIGLDVGVFLAVVIMHPRIVVRARKVHHNARKLAADANLKPGGCWAICLTKPVRTPPRKLTEDARHGVPGHARENPPARGGKGARAERSNPALNMLARAYGAALE